MLPAAIAAASQIVSGVQSLSGGSGKDAERIAANLTAYNRALAGDANARAFLKQRTGEYGIANVPGYGEVGGWATATAKADAKAKFNALTTAGAVNAAIAEKGGEIRDAANSVGYDVYPTIGGLKTEYLLLIGALAVAAFVYFRKGR